MYNAVTREVEKELFPMLRNFGMRFYCYNPLAGGMLTGKHLPKKTSETGGGQQNSEQGSGEQEKTGRFGNKMYVSRFWNDDYFEKLQKVQDAIDAANQNDYFKKLGNSSSDKVLLVAQ